MSDTDDGFELPDKDYQPDLPTGTMSDDFAADAPDAAELIGRFGDGGVSAKRGRWVEANLETIDALIAGTLVAVPVEPTEAMMRATGEHFDFVWPEVERRLRHEWAAMIAEHTKGRVEEISAAANNINGLSGKTGAEEIIP